MDSSVVLSALPPSLGCFLWGFPQQSVVHHERQRAVQSQQHSQVTLVCAHVAAGVFLADEFFLPFFSFVLVSFYFLVTGNHLLAGAVNLFVRHAFGFSPLCACAPVPCQTEHLRNFTLMLHEG